MNRLRELWRHRDAAFELLAWVRSVIKASQSLAEARQRLAQGAARGDLDAVVSKLGMVAADRDRYVREGD